MTQMRAIVLRELRAYFYSPIAYIFLLAFAGTALFTFFNVNGFFARGQADMRALFDSVPLLTLLLVPALTMRLWADEAKAGTLELLMTLPVRESALVSGKFLASWALFAVALAITAPLAISVSLLGNLDWGPVLGGYLGALLLGAAYLSIGQFVSALTENQILAFILALLLCMTLYGLGSEIFTGLFSDRTAELLRSLGSGSRFDSIARGVLDLRDLLYYLSVSTIFLGLSVGALRLKRWA